jgi:hypothetical protein
MTQKRSVLPNYLQHSEIDRGSRRLCALECLLVIDFRLLDLVCASGVVLVWNVYWAPARHFDVLVAVRCLGVLIGCCNRRCDDQLEEGAGYHFRNLDVASLKRGIVLSLFHTKCMQNRSKHGTRDYSTQKL